MKSLFFICLLLVFCFLAAGTQLETTRRLHTLKKLGETRALSLNAKRPLVSFSRQESNDSDSKSGSFGGSDSEESSDDSSQNASEDSDVSDVRISDEAEPYRVVTGHSEDQYDLDNCRYVALVKNIVEDDEVIGQAVDNVYICPLD